MASLYARGWRQGSVFSAQLPLSYVVVGDDGTPVARSDPHERWVVVTQDCDLNSTDEAEPEATIETRPVFTHDPPEDWGIRSSRLLLSDGEYLAANSPRLTVSGQTLSALLERGDADRNEPAPARRLALKTWLGLRYDRPAVPTGLVPLAQRIAAAVQQKRFREIAGRTRDVLMLFDDSVMPPRFSLYAILEHSDDEEEVLVWLSAAALEIPVELAVPYEIRAAPATGISLDLIEKSYPADVSRITWRPNQPEPEGAL